MVLCGKPLKIKRDPGYWMCLYLTHGAFPDIQYQESIIAQRTDSLVFSPNEKINRFMQR
jgi:hypothetical protein